MLAIISMVIAVGLPAIERVTYQRLNSTSRKFVGLIRTIKNDAILLNTVHRLVIDLDHQAWWVEQQNQFQLLSDGQEEPRPTKKKNKGLSSGNDDPAPNFTPDDKYSKKPVPLPDGVGFSGVLKEREGLIKQGVAYINFFPNGYSEQAIIYLVKVGSTHFDGYSVKIHAVSNQVDIIRSYVQTFD